MPHSKNCILEFSLRFIDSAYGYDISEVEKPRNPYSSFVLRCSGSIGNLVSSLCISRLSLSLIHSLRGSGPKEFITQSPGSHRIMLHFGRVVEGAGRVLSVGELMLEPAYHIHRREEDRPTTTSVARSGSTWRFRVNQGRGHHTS